MSANRDVLYLIPARGGSKGIPRKNIKLLNGKPLIQYSIEIAQELTFNENICVSTDDVEIKNTVENFGLKVPFIRPIMYSGDEAGSYEVIIHALDYYKEKGVNYETVVLLQPTSPFRLKSHIEEAMDLMSPLVEMVCSVKESKANPYYNIFEENEAGYIVQSKQGRYQRRQECPKVFEQNGSVYVLSVEALRKKNMNKFDRIVKYEMEEKYSIDIDEPMDWLVAEWMVNQKSEKL